MSTTTRSTQTLRWIAIVASLAMMLVALAGFGNALASAGSHIATASRAKSVSIKGFAFHAGTTRVKAGTTVTFSNKDGVAHTATGKGFNTGNIAPGSSKSITFKSKGTFNYFCKIHPDMHGKVIVE